MDDDVLSLSASSMSELNGDGSGEEVLQSVAVSRGWNFSPSDTELLVRLVKLSQKMGYIGAGGGTWKEYLKSISIGQSHDPARHPWNVLADFIESLTEDSACREVQKLVDWERRLQEEDEIATTTLELGGLSVPAEGSIWELVRRTQAHPRFAELYNSMPAFQEGWQRRRATPLYDEEPTLLAIDCEMCGTVRDDKALLSLCLVDVDGAIRCQELVKPDDEVTDFRTAVTGHTAEDLASVRYTREDAQRNVLEAMEGRVVLVGHALHHDLRALRLDYQPVIDTSLLFSYQGLSEATPGLSDVVSKLLGRQLREVGKPHNVTADARAAMDLALYEQQKGPTPPLPAPTLDVPEEDLQKLLVHSMAPGMRDVDLIYLFPTGCPPILEINREAPNAKKATISFTTAADAVAAFRLLPGQDSTDSVGRAQKVVSVPEGKFQGRKVRVRVWHSSVQPGRRSPSPVGVKRKR